MQNSDIKILVHPKIKIVNIYSPSCCSKPKKTTLIHIQNTTEDMLNEIRDISVPLLRVHAKKLQKVMSRFNLGFYLRINIDQYAYIEHIKYGKREPGAQTCALEAQESMRFVIAL